MGKVAKALDKSLAYEQEPEVAPRETAASSRDNLGSERHAPGEAGGAERVAPSPRRPQAPAPLPSSPALSGVAGWDEKLVVFSDSASPLAENFRLLRTRILYPETGTAYKKILITSTVPGSGKSFVCANLGISLAQGLDHHALLVDCDLRRSRLAALFNCQASIGLVNYLRDGADLGGLIVKTGMEKLSLIPSGPRAANPAELLGSHKVEQMLAELENRYRDRIILIDTPPTLAASETAVLAKHVDGIILVVRWGVGGRAPIQQLAASLGPGKIIGVVFNAYQANMLSAKMSGYDEYSQYAGSYGD